MCYKTKSKTRKKISKLSRKLHVNSLTICKEEEDLWGCCWGMAGKACDASIPYGYQFMSQLLCFWSHFLLKVWEKQQKMVQGFGLLSPIWEAWMKLLDLVYSSHGFVAISKVNQWMGDVSLCNCDFQINTREGLFPPIATSAVPQLHSFHQ